MSYGYSILVYVTSLQLGILNVISDKLELSGVQGTVKVMSLSSHMAGRSCLVRCESFSSSQSELGGVNYEDDLLKKSVLVIPIYCTF